MTTYQLFCVLVIIMCGLGGCSENDSSLENKSSQEQGSHVWEEQTATLDKAREVEGMLQESADAERKKIEEQTR